MGDMTLALVREPWSMDSKAYSHAQSYDVQEAKYQAGEE